MRMDRYIFECTIKARPSGAIGTFYLHPTVQVYAKTLETAKEQALQEICVARNLETYPPMSVRCLGVDDS